MSSLTNHRDTKNNNQRQSAQQKKDFNMVEPVFVKHADEMFYFELEKLQSNQPFSIDIGNGDKIFYYLQRDDANEICVPKIKETVALMHNCRGCITRCKKQGLLFGPDGYAVSFDTGGTLYKKAVDARLNMVGINTQGTFIVTTTELDKYPRNTGRSPVTGIEWNHLGLNVDKQYITSNDVANEIPQHMTNALWNGTLDANLDEIVGNLRSDLVIIKRVLNGGKVLRRESFWDDRIDTLDRIHKFADRFTNGDNWSRMTPTDKMHVRMFALFNGGPRRWSSEGHNISFMAARRVIDLSKDGHSEQTLPGLMNQMSNPETHMRQQIDTAREKHNATDKFNASLAWSDKSDLDIVGRNRNTGEICYFSAMNRGGMSLRFDANAGNRVSNPVEDLAFTQPGEYDVFVNLYSHDRLQSRDEKIPFIIAIGLNGTITEHEDIWDSSVRGTNRDYSNSDLNKMMFITTVKLTPEMLESSSTELTDKQSNRLAATMPKFNAAFCPLVTHLANEIDLLNTVAMVPPKPNTEDSESLMNDLSSMLLNKDNRKKRKTLSDKCMTNLSSVTDIMRMVSDGTGVTMTIQGRGNTPTIATVHNRMENLTESLCLSTYYEYGLAPVQPDRSRTSKCRFGDEWSSTPDELTVTNITPVSHSSGSFKGYFFSLTNVHLPDPSERWVNGAGMYVSDLKNDFHEVRGIWGAHNSSVRPGYGDRGIGIFVFEKSEFNATVNGVFKTVSV